jgi:hypothetical protein
MIRMVCSAATSDRGITLALIPRNTSKGWKSAVATFR